MKTARISVVLFGCLGVMLLLVASGIKHFTLNGQAWDMWRDFGYDPLRALLIGHPHGLRYLVYYPVFALAGAFGAAPDFVFSFTCVFAVFALAYFADRVLFDLWGHKGHIFHRDIITIALFSLSLLMNGRLIFAFLGYMLVIFVAVNWFGRRHWGVKHFAFLVFACILTGVSSGTLVIAMALVAGIFAISVLDAPAVLVRNRQVPISIFIVLLLFSIPTLIGIKKNLDYYGGGEHAVIKMLDHGAGGDVKDTIGLEPPEDHGARGGSLTDLLHYWWVAVLILAVAARWLGWRPIAMARSASPQQNIVHLAALLTLAGGLFGYSVLAMTIVPLALLVPGYVAPVSTRLKELAR